MVLAAWRRSAWMALTAGVFASMSALLNCTAPERTNVALSVAMKCSGVTVADGVSIIVDATPDGDVSSVRCV